MAGRAYTTWHLVTVLGIAAALLPVDQAFAYSNKVESACRGDYKRLCPHYKVGSPQLRACMEAKQGEISWTCISALMDEGVVDRRQARR